MNTQEIIQLWHKETQKLAFSSATLKATGKQMGVTFLYVVAFFLIIFGFSALGAGKILSVLLGLLLLAVGIYLIVIAVRKTKKNKSGFENELSSRINSPKTKEEENRAIVFYFEPELKMYQSQLTDQNAQGNLAGGVVGGMFGATGGVLKMIPGMGLAGSAVSGIGKLAAKGTAMAVNASNKEATRRSLMNQKRFITDTTFDEIVNRRVSNDEVLREKGLEELGLDNSQLTELPPICIKNYWIDEDDEMPLVATGIDGTDRTLTKQTTWLYFTPKQLCACDYFTDILTEKAKKETTEFFWRDVVGISKISKQMNSGIEKKYLIIKDASGDSYACIYNDEDAKTNQAIRGLINYYREIKENH